jgi:hypothetical protein
VIDSQYARLSLVVMSIVHLATDEVWSTARTRGMISEVLRQNRADFSRAIAFCADRAVLEVRRCLSWSRTLSGRLPLEFLVPARN